MSRAKSLVLKYSIVKKKFKGGVPKFDPSKKWVEYSLDLIEAKDLLRNVDFITRFDLLKVISKIESKIYFHENHANFDFRSATNDLRTARKLLRL